MNEQNQPHNSLQDIHDIKRIMERSSRFISLSGLSGIAAGICALVGSYFAHILLEDYYVRYNDRLGYSALDFQKLKLNFLVLAAAVLAVALSSSFYFTWRRAKENSQPLWNLTSRKLMWNMLVPLVSGGLFILAMLQYSEWRFVAPACLIFYGLALVNGSKYTLSDIRYLGYCEIILGFINTQFIGYGLYFWAFGFGVLHIVYGAIMWWKYEKK
jgi:hypothetical protein